MPVGLSVSIHAPYIGSDLRVGFVPGFPFCVSIHAPYIGSDLIAIGIASFDKVSIHAPYIGSDSMTSRCSSAIFAFQSTLPT